MGVPARVAPLLALAGALGACRGDSKTEPKPAGPAQPAASLRDAVLERAYATFPDLGALPLPREYGEDPLWVTADALYDRRPEGEPLATLDGRRLPGAGAVAELAPAFERRRAAQQAPYHLDLFADAATPWSTIARVLQTARDAGFSRLTVGVRTREGVRRLPVGLAGSDDASDVIVAVAPDGLRAFSRSGARGAADAPAVAVGPAEFGVLASGLDRLVGRTAEPLLVRGYPDVSFGAVATAVAAIAPVAGEVRLDPGP
jgi:hypothetical protein